MYAGENGLELLQTGGPYALRWPNPHQGRVLGHPYPIEEWVIGVEGHQCPLKLFDAVEVGAAGQHLSCVVPVGHRL